MAVIVNGDGILTGISSLATALTDITSGRGTITGVTTVGTLQLGAGVSISSPRSQQAAIFTNNTEFLTVDDAGRVGVGTITPNSDAHPENEKKINVGFITAKSIAGDIDARNVVVAGISTFTGAIDANSTSNFNGVLTASSGVRVGSDSSGGSDNYISVGDSADLKVFHDGTHSKLVNITNTLVLQSDALSITNQAGNSNRIISASTGNVSLCFSDSVKLKTTGSGVDITDTLNVAGIATFGANIFQTGGRIVRGSASTVQDGDSIAGGVNITGTDMDSSVVMSVFGNDADFNRISGAKSRNATIGNHTIVNDGDVLLSLKGFGSDGTNFEEAAQLEFQVDGSPGNNVMPGRMVFKTTTTDGVAERMRIKSTGTIESYSPDDTTPNIRWRSDDTNWFGSLNQSVEGSTIGTFLAVAGDWSSNGSTYSATKNFNGSFETRAIALHNQFNGGAGKVSFLVKAGGSSTTDGTVSEILKIDNDGIKFGGDTAAANALDDYEEGTYNVTFISGTSGITYTTQAGNYRKIGTLVRFDFYIQVNGGVSNGAMFEISLPFTCDAGSNSHRGSGVITYHNANNSNAGLSGDNFPALYIGSNSAQCYMGPTQWTAPSGTAQSNRYFIGGGTFHST